MNDTNPQKEKFWKLLKSGESILLTGRAGTGKTSLIRTMLEDEDKSYVVLAPTGISAINLRGKTLHSFFLFPLRPIIPGDNEIKKLNSQKINILKKADAIVIDEISMVRSDLLDAVDQSLRKNLNSKLPFAGKQLIFVGDMFQLRPVVTNHQGEREILEVYYKNSLYFFDSIAYKTLKPSIVELVEVYRQENDLKFLGLLDRVRYGLHNQEDLEVINSRYNPNYSSNEIAIELCSTNKLADEINLMKLLQLQTKIHRFQAKVDKNFDEKFYPTAFNLELKIGAQVMMLRNSTSYVNGTIGRIIDFKMVDDEDSGEFVESEYPYEDDLSSSREFTPVEMAIIVETDEGNIIEVVKETWENIEYQYDAENQKIVSKTIGEFTQYPMKLAWAVTIHKSQGLTFNRMYLNLGSGAFDTGQTYVALSRCRTLGGIILRKKIKNSDIKVDPAVVQFWQENVDSNVYSLFDF